MDFEMSLESMLALTDTRIWDIAEKYNRVWAGKVGAGMTSNSVRNSFDGIKSELAVAKRLKDKLGCTELKLYGIDEYVSTAEYGEDIRHPNKPDIECMRGGEHVKIEVKSGRPHLYPHRQFLVRMVDKWEVDGITVVYWVDISKDDRVKNLLPFTLEEIKLLPIKNNYRGEPCYTFTGGYDG